MSRLTQVAIAACLISGCGGAGRSNSATSVHPLIHGDAKTFFEDEAIWPTESDQRLVFLLVQRSIETCMERSGFSYAIPPFQAQVPSGIDDYFGYDDVEVAKAEGYTTLLPAQPITDESVQPAIDVGVSASVEYDAALYGPEDDLVRWSDSTGTTEARIGGCNGRALTEIVGDYRQYVRALSTTINARNIVNSEVIADPDYQAALETYDSCMTSAGYAAGDAVNARFTAQRLVDTGTPAGSPEVRALAVVDAECNHDAQLRQTGLRLYDQQFKMYLEENNDLLLTFRDAQIRALSLVTRSEP